MKKFKSILLFVFIIGVPQYLIGQAYQVNDDKTKVNILGSSSLHDWESEVQEVSGKGDFTLKGNEIANINSLEVYFKVKSIESGKSKMDELTHDALKEKHNPNVILKLKEVKKIEHNDVRIMASLEIAGKVKYVILQGLASVKNDTITIVGEHTLDMTEFDVEPPTAMFGTIKVEKTVTIDYSLVMNK